MRTFTNEIHAGSSMVAWLDGVQMSEQDRKNAKAWLRNTESVLDLIWLAGARIRAAFARGPANRAPVGTGLSRQDSVVVHLP